VVHRPPYAVRDLAPLSNPRLSLFDLSLRIAFFAFAPVGIVFAAALFPVRGALVDVAIALGIFVLGEASQRAIRFRWLRWFLNEAFAFEQYYRTNPTRPFLYYVFYPLLFPYWLIQRQARREFVVFRGYTLGGLAVLVATFVWQYYAYWLPELSFRQFLPTVLLTLAVEMLLALSLLMPVATTVVCYHRGGYRGRLALILAVGLLSSLLSLGYLLQRRDPIVSYATRERVSLRSKVSQYRAQRTLHRAAWAAQKQLVTTPAVDIDGKVTGLPLEKARAVLSKFYKSDECYAFDIWANAKKNPSVLVIYFEYSVRRRALWLAIDQRGRQIVDRAQLPRGLFKAMHAAADGSEDLLEIWPDALKPEELGL